MASAANASQQIKRQPARPTPIPPKLKTWTNLS